MESIFPFLDPVETETTEDLAPMAKEYAWDFNKEDFAKRGNKLCVVEGDEAIKVWLWKLFSTERFRYLIFDWDYGHELEELMGRGYTEAYLNSEAERFVREAIEYNLGDYITKVTEINVDFTGEQLKISFVVQTIYEGEVEMIV